MKIYEFARGTSKSKIFLPRLNFGFLSLGKIKGVYY